MTATLNIINVPPVEIAIGTIPEGKRIDFLTGKAVHEALTLNVNQRRTINVLVKVGSICAMIQVTNEPSMMGNPSLGIARMRLGQLPKC